MTTQHEHAASVPEQNASFQKIRQRLQMIRLAARQAPIDVRSLSRRVVLPAPPREVYAALIDQQRLAAITGTTVHFEPAVGGEFWFEDGRVVGLVSELLENRHLAMYCHFEHEHWPENHYSTVTLIVNAEANASTRLVFFQQEIPAAALEVVSGWWDAHLISRLPGAFSGQSV